MPRFAVILPAAGQSSRFRDQHYKKPFAPLDGRPVWMHVADKFANRKEVVQAILIIAAEDRVVERELASRRIEFPFGQAAVDRIPGRARVEHASALFHVGPRLQVVEETAERRILFDSEQFLRMFPRECDVITSANHRST